MQEVDGSLDHLDLRSLRLLALVLETRNITRAAEILGLSQPAASRVLAQLRRALGNDPLLVRTRSGAALTPRAEALRPLVSDALAAARRVFATGAFDPSTASGAVRVASTDYGALTVLAPLAGGLSRAAPGLRLDAVPWGPDTLADLEDGRLDLALYADGSLTPDFHARELFRDTYACLMREDHPVLAFRDAHGRVPLERLARLPRAVMLFPDGRQMLPDDALTTAFGAEPRAGGVVFRTPYFLSGPLALAGSDAVMCLPARAARLMVRLGDLALVTLPETPDFPYRLVWHARTHADLRLRWVRHAVCAVLARASDG